MTVVYKGTKQQALVDVPLNWTELMVLQHLLTLKKRRCEHSEIAELREKLRGYLLSVNEFIEQDLALGSKE